MLSFIRELLNEPCKQISGQPYTHKEHDIRAPTIKELDAKRYN